jgi:arylsulfatase A-like enzyme
MGVLILGDLNSHEFSYETGKVRKMAALNRRDFIRTTGVALALPAFCAAAAETGKKRPNLLIIHTDEHNFRTLGCYRETLSPEQAFMWGKDAIVETPHIDWIAKNGAICTKFYAATPVCSPSRASFVSGKYPQNTPVVNNNIRMSDEVITFAEVLRRAGYATGYAGKWHLDGTGKPQWAPKRQFGFADNRYMFNRGHWKKLTDTAAGPKIDTGDKPSYDCKGANEKNFTTDWLADKALDFIRANKDKPFCYMVSFPDPHGPDTVRKPYDRAYESMTFEKPRTHGRPAESAPSWAKPNSGSYDQSKYYGMVKCIDENVGKMLACLRSEKLLDHTIVVFTSDHGDLRGEHHRHNKGVPLEASAKIPFLIYCPEKIKAGTTVTQALGTSDFMPTILPLMGVAATGKEDGRDASALLANGKPPDGWKDITFVRGTQGRKAAGWLAAFTSRYKLIVSDKDDPWLIDMEKDPDELKNFCRDPEYREIAGSLAKELVGYGKRFNDVRATDGKTAGDLRGLMR